MARWNHRRISEAVEASVARRTGEGRRYPLHMTQDVRGIPELDLARIERFCRRRVPARLAEQVRLEVEVRGTAVTIVECRAPWSPDIGPEWSRLPIARLRFGIASAEWTLFWCDRNLAFHRYSETRPTPIIDDLLAVLDTDPTSIFWG